MAKAAAALCELMIPHGEQSPRDSNTHALSHTHMHTVCSTCTLLHEKPQFRVRRSVLARVPPPATEIPAFLGGFRVSTCIILSGGLRIRLHPGLPAGASASTNFFFWAGKPEGIGSTGSGFKHGGWKSPICLLWVRVWKAEQHCQQTQVSQPASQPASRP